MYDAIYDQDVKPLNLDEPLIEEGVLKKYVNAISSEKEVIF